MSSYMVQMYNTSRADGKSEIVKVFQVKKKCKLASEYLLRC